MSTSGNNLSLKAYIDGKEASIEIPYESLFELFEFRKQYEEYVKDTSTKSTVSKSDDMIRESAKLFIEHGVCSTELLQRKLHIGYGRAASIIDELTDMGIVGDSAGGNKGRELLVSSIDELDSHIKAFSKSVDHGTDDMIRESAKLFVKHGVCSTGLLQRHFHIGYGRAASIIDELENIGVITPLIGNKRFIKIKNEEELCDIFKKQIALNVVQLKDMRSAIEVILKRKRCTTPLVQKSLDWGYEHTQTTILNLEIIGAVSPRIEGKIERDILIKNLAEYDKLIEQLQLSK